MAEELHVSKSICGMHFWKRVEKEVQLTERNSERSHLSNIEKVLFQSMPRIIIHQLEQKTERLKSSRLKLEARGRKTIVCLEEYLYEAIKNNTI